MKNKTDSYNERMSKRYKGQKKAKQTTVRAEPYTGTPGLSRVDGITLTDVLVPDQGGKNRVALIIKVYV